MYNRQILTSRQQGFSLLKVMLWLVIVGVVAWHGMKFMHPYYVSWKVQSVFDGIAAHMDDADEAAVRASLPHLMSVNYIDEGDLPAEFYTNLKVVNDGRGIEISSRYHVRIWMLGAVEAVDAQGYYDPDSLKGLDVWRDRARIVLHFSPHAGP